ncbi:hypothetical protein BGW36DRAFT_428141 [Talaromyces proteolyticus]|uniref:Uncharacterized protein n=1 Tax=Talaromyces proteolyticus TaxID=1131652 RepID=A0AAD4KME9_9EURO|nr:uncharacterized protein BGW36DRAFT_428141 [Talaromyces proteolyticus]KAH8696117.1 hypothetical protein BGW36DRAFT_428141 [Talaromyces proteolyticus]
MARRYEIEELLWLRNSPLVTKPDKLPPAEEWMGPIPDPATRRPTNGRDQAQNENSTRRPSLFETPRHISRNSNSEDIVLGPPKTAFSSATRMFGKGSIDATDRTQRFNDSDEAKNDRFNFRDKFLKDREGTDRELDRRENKYGGPHSRRNEREDWNAGRPRRTFNQDEQDQKPKRNGDAGRWDGRDKPDELVLGRKDKDGRFAGREGLPRGRHEKSWFRDENAPETGELEDEKPFMRSREWRRDRQTTERDWNKGARFDQDPEWMDSTDRDEPKQTQTHTQEDFQRWKERMKAGSAPPVPLEEKTGIALEEVAPEDQKTEASRLDGELFAANKHHLPMDTGFEKFFGLLGDAKHTPQEVATTGPGESIKTDPGSSKASKSSRFATLFSPPPESSVKQPEPIALEKTQPDRPVSTDADQEGFQRILQMLGGRKSRNSTPQMDSTQSSRPPSYAHPDNRPTPPPGLSSPSRDTLNQQQHEFMAAQEGVAPRALHPPPGMEAMLPNRDPQTMFRDRDNLLRLMQQVKVSPTPGQHGNPGLPSGLPAGLSSQGGPTPGILNVPDLLSRPQGMQKVPRNQPFLDDPAIANMQRTEVELHEPSRRPVNGLPVGYFDEIPYPGAPQGGQGSTRPAAGGRGPPPMGLQRPPGFEQMPPPPPPPPGWAGQLPPQQPTPNRGMNPNFLNGPMPPHMHGNMPPPPPHNERPPFLRGISGNASGNTFGPPPGMMPPPGYGPPPPSGFPPMPPHNPEAMLNISQHQQQQGAGSSGPPPSSRHLLDMFAQANGGDARGAMLGGPGLYR